MRPIYIVGGTQNSARWLASFLLVRTVTAPAPKGTQTSAAGFPVLLHFFFGMDDNEDGLVSAGPMPRTAEESPRSSR